MTAQPRAIQPTLVRVVIAILIALLHQGAVCAQQSASRQVERANELVLFAEPAAGGAQYLRGLMWKAGVTAKLGPLFGIEVSSPDVDDVREWGAAYATIGYQNAGFQLLFSPVGAAEVVGNDFSAVYPSGQAGAEFALNRLRIGSVIRVVRIAGPSGTGTYWTQWVPLRLGLAFGW